MSILDIFLWGVLPYVVVVILVGGTIWRYKYDQFGWTTRSSQFYESKLLKFASPLFHYGMLGVFGGHVVGLMIPQSWTEAVGITEDMYHIGGALIMGIPFGLVTLLGLIVMVFRRRTNKSVFAATTVNDKIMYVLLMATIAFGMAVTVISAFQGPHGHNYRADISPWFRSLFIFQPEVSLMHDVPLEFKIHIISAFVLFILWPFTRLVHAFTAPFHYLFRPYIVYRSRGGEKPGGRRGWDPVGTSDRESLLK
ncbi:respiratory nitrate reductase subunit gamma [Rothia aerolata]|uniref:Nitrate reductase-like protein NarX n=1 Tax=Rothia aerolata TaxID=1812262 RepID=A0A917IRT0_9MICC|nr:respiratory nitrate reductase subunit gamma [Rothia aerolata]GGH60629.1 nitrate reductase subunit gamma [Rothia aerolata]